MHLLTRRTRARAVAAVGALVTVVALSACNPVVVTPGTPTGTIDVTFSINTAQGVKAISPLIYGLNSTTNLASNRPGMVRQGGNRWTAYNWETNASNAGSDWYFQNDNFLSASTVPGAAVKPTIDAATGVGAAALVTVPIVDYVAGDELGNGDVRNSGANYLTTRMKANHPLKGSALSTSPNATDANVYEDEFVNWLKVNEPNANLIFSLDNEPDLWSSTHAEVHPAQLTYAEIIQRDKDYAAAIKSVMPNAKVSGPVNYGYEGFTNLQNATDAAGRNFLDAYLAAMKSADTAAGKRLIDYLDIHWYPEAQGAGTRITTADGTTPAIVAAREQAPRSLWDPTYTETSWITSCCSGPIDLLPATQARINSKYPGTGIAITEWNYGGGDTVSGAIASADVLGIFGQQGVAMASMWPLNGNESYTYAAFRAFRNYDGAGGSFGDNSVSATSSDVNTATVYASTRAGAPNKPIIVAINKSTSAKNAAIKVTCSATLKNAKVYTITAGGGANVVHGADISTTATNAWNYTMPAQSVSIIVSQ